MLWQKPQARCMWMRIRRTLTHTHTHSEYHDVVAEATDEVHVEDDDDEEEDWGEVDETIKCRECKVCMYVLVSGTNGHQTSEFILDTVC